MSFDVLGDVNWLPVIVAALAYFALGGIWFARKVFGDIWTKSIGWDASTEESPGPAVYVGPLITCSGSRSPLSSFPSGPDRHGTRQSVSR